MARNVMERFGPEITDPSWLGDFVGREMMAVFPAAIDPAQFSDNSGVIITTTAIAAVDATSVAVAALAEAIPAGTTLYFGASKKLALVTARAEKGATALTVQALPTALASGDVAIWSKAGRKLIPSGTPVGRTLAERNAGTPFGPLASTDDEVGIILFDVFDAENNPDCELVRSDRAVTIKENYLPGWSGLAGAVQTLIRANFYCIVGVD